MAQINDAQSWGFVSRDWLKSGCFTTRNVPSNLTHTVGCGSASFNRQHQNRRLALFRTIHSFLATIYIILYLYGLYVCIYTFCSFDTWIYIYNHRQWYSIQHIYHVLTEKNSILTCRTSHLLNDAVAANFCHPSDAVESPGASRCGLFACGPGPQGALGLSPGNLEISVSLRGFHMLMENHYVVHR